MDKPFEMPAVKVSDKVLWFLDGDPEGDPHVAWVTQRGQSRVSVAVLRPDAYNLDPIRGVPHVLDPKLGTWDDASAGCWMHIAEWEEREAAREKEREEATKEDEKRRGGADRRRRKEEPAEAATG